jgi:hypothetical protein
MTAYPTREVVAMINKWSCVVFALAFIAGAMSVGGAAAAKQSEEGFIILVNQFSGEQIVAYCEGDTMTGYAYILDDSPVLLGTPLGTECSDKAFPNFSVSEAVNLHPYNGSWLIAPEDDALLSGHITRRAYTCTENGAVFVIKAPDYPLYTFVRGGSCGPGAVPG